MTYQRLIMAVEDSTGLSNDALHIYAAVFVQILVALTMRRSLAHPLPWACSLAFAFASQWAAGKQAVGLHGLAAATAVPTLLLILARFAPALLRPETGRAREVVDEES